MLHRDRIVHIRKIALSAKKMPDFLWRSLPNAGGHGGDYHLFRRPLLSYLKPNLRW